MSIVLLVFMLVEFEYVIKCNDGPYHENWVAYKELLKRPVQHEYG